MEEAVVVANNVTNQSTDQNSWFGMLIYCIVVFGIIYLFMVRPNKKRMAEYQKMIDSLQVGNKVLAAGIYGVIKKIKEHSIDLEISKGVVVEVNKNAVVNVEEKK